MSAMRSPQSDESRSATRFPLRFKTERRIKGHRVEEASIADISRFGLGLSGKFDLNVGDQFEIRLPEAGWIRCSVVHKQPNKMGCLTERPLPEKVIAAVRLGGEHDAKDGTQLSNTMTVQVRSARKLSRSMRWILACAGGCWAIAIVAYLLATAA